METVNHKIPYHTLVYKLTMPQNNAVYLLETTCLAKATLNAALWHHYRTQVILSTIYISPAKQVFMPAPPAFKFITCVRLNDNNFHLQPIIFQ